MRKFPLVHRCLVVIIVVFALLRACPAAEEEIHTFKLLIGYLPVTGHVKLFVAKEEGFFSDERLDVELIGYNSSGDGLAALRMRKLDVGVFGTVAPLAYIANGADLRILCGIMGEDAYLLASPETAKRIAKPADLRGLKVGTVRLSTGDTILRGKLREAGLTWPADVNLIGLTNPDSVLRALRSGQVDAGVVWGPYDLVARSEGMATVFSTADLFPKHPCCRLVVRSDVMRRRADVWPHLLRAILRAEKFIHDPANRERTLDDVSRYIAIDRRMIEHGLFAGRLDQSSDPNVRAMLRIWDTMKEVGLVKDDVDLMKHIDIEYYGQALGDLMASEPEEEFWRDLWRVYEERNIDVMRTTKDSPADDNNMKN